MRPRGRRFFYDKPRTIPRDTLKSQKQEAKRRRPVQVEPLEPRLLLSADFVPFAVEMASAGDDLTLRYDEASASLQLVDETGPAPTVVAARELATTSEVRVVGTPGNDRLAIDASVLGLSTQPAAPAGDIDGDGVVGLSDFAVLALEFGSTDSSSPADLDGDGVVGLPDFGIFAANLGQTTPPAGPLAVSFEAGAGDDRLVGPGVDATWSVTGPGAGEVEGVAFSGVENLEGAAGNEDTFVFGPEGALAGVVEGGDAGFDTLVVEGGSYDTVTYRPDASDSGTLELDGTQLTFAGMEPVDLTGMNAVTNLVFDLNGPIDPVTNQPSGSSDLRNEIRLQDDATAGMRIVSDIAMGQPGSFEEVVFDNPTSIRIDAAGGGDLITIASLDPGYTGPITLVGGADDDTYAFVAADFGNVTITELANGGSDTVDFSGFSGDLSTAGTITYSDETVESFVGFQQDAQRDALREGLRAFVTWADRLAKSGDLGQPLAGVTGNVAVSLGTALDLADTLRPLVDAIEGSTSLTPDALVTLLTGFSRMDVARLDRAILGETFAPTIGTADSFTFTLALDDRDPVVLGPLTGHSSLAALADAINTAIEDGGSGAYFNLVEAVVTGDGASQGRLAFQVLSPQIDDFALTVVDANSRLGFPPGPQKLENLDQILADLDDADVRVSSTPVLSVDLSTGTPVFTIRFQYTADRTSDFNIDLGSEADAKGVTFESTASVAMASEAVWNLAFRFTTGATSTFEIDVEDFDVRGAVNAAGSQNVAPGTTMDIGFLGAEIQAPDGGRLSLDAMAGLDGTQWLGLDAADELLEDASQIALRSDDLVRAGSIDVDLPVDVKPGIGFSETNPISIQASQGASGVFAGDDFEPIFNNFADVETFANLDAPGFVQLIGKVRDWLDQLGDLDFLKSFPIPFVEGAISTVVDFADAFGDAILFDDGDDGDDRSDETRLVTDLNGLLRAPLDGLVQFKVSDGFLVLEAIDASVTALNVTPTNPANEPNLGFIAPQSSAPPPNLEIAAEEKAPGNGQLTQNVSLLIEVTRVSGGPASQTLTIGMAQTADNESVGNDVVKLLDADNSPTFGTAQELKDALLGLVADVLAFDVRYDAVEDQLAYDVNLSNELFDLQVPLSFDLDLGPLGDISTVDDPRLTLGGEVGLELTLVLDLRAPSEVGTPINEGTRLDALRDVDGVEDVVKAAPAITALDAGGASAREDVAIGQVALTSQAVDFSVDRSLRVRAESLINGVLSLSSPENTLLWVRQIDGTLEGGSSRTQPLRNVPGPATVAGGLQSPELTFGLRIDTVDSQGNVTEGSEFEVKVPVKTYSVPASAFKLRWLPDIERAIVDAQNALAESRITLPSTYTGPLWEALGFAAGQTIQVSEVRQDSDPGVNDGSYQIEAITGQGRTLTLVQSLRQGATGVTATIEGPGTLTLQDTNWTALGFGEGERISIRGSQQNDGTYLIVDIDDGSDVKATLAQSLTAEMQVAELEITGDGAQVRPAEDATLTLDLGSEPATQITIARERDANDPFAPATSDNANLSDLVLDVQTALDAAGLERIEVSLDGSRLVLSLTDAAAVASTAALAFAAPASGASFGTITRGDAGGSFLDDGFAKGQLILIQGSDANDGSYRIRDDDAAVSANLLQVEKLAGGNDLSAESEKTGIRLSQTLRITAAGGTGLGFQAGQVGNLDDLVVVTSDATRHFVSLDGAVDLGDVIERITLATGGTSSVMPDAVLVRINDAGTGLDLVQRPTLLGDAQLTFEHSEVGPDTIVRGDGRWDTDGFGDDQTIRVGGSFRNDDIFQTAAANAVSADGKTLTLAAGERLFAEGPAKGITVTLAEATESFRVESVNSSPAALRLGILRADATEDVDDDGAIDQNDGDGVIAGAPIGGASLLDRLILEDPRIFATLEIDTPAGVNLLGSFGFFDVELGASGRLVGTVSLGLTDPTPDTDGITLPELFTEIRENPGGLISGPTLSGPTLQGEPRLTFDENAGTITITRIPGMPGDDPGSWLEDGFDKDQLIRVEGAGANDGDYFIDELTSATVLTVSRAGDATPISAGTVSGAEVTGAMGTLALGVTLPDAPDFIDLSDAMVRIALFEAGNPFFGRGFQSVQRLALVAGEDPTRDAIELSVAVASGIGVGDEVEVLLKLAAGGTQMASAEIRKVSQDRRRLELTDSLGAPAGATIASILVSDGISSKQHLTVATDELALAATDAIVFQDALDDAVEVGDRVAAVLTDAGGEEIEADARIASISSDRLRIELDADLAEQTSGLRVSELRITRPPVTQLEFPNLDDLLDFSDIGFRDILRGLIALSDFLGDFEEFGFLNDEIPLIDLSFNDLLLYADRFAQAVEDAERNPAGSLQTLEPKLEELLGIDDGTGAGKDPFDIDLELVEEDRGAGVDTHKILKIGFVIGAGFSEGLAVDFDLTPDTVGDLLTLNGQAGLNASGDILFELAIGIDFTRTELQGAPALGFEHVVAPADVTGAVTFINGSGANDQLMRSGGWTGFVEGMLVEVTGSQNNDGSYRVAGVAGELLTLAEGEELRDETAGSGITVTAGSVDRILRDAGSFAADGFLPGQSIHVKGPLDPNSQAGTANTGDYTLAYVGSNVVALRPRDDGQTRFADATETGRTGVEIIGARSISIFEDSALTANLAATAEDITFRGAVGPLGVFVEGGSARIGAPQGSDLFRLGLDFDADGTASETNRKILDDLSLSRDFSAGVQGEVAAELPVAFPVDSIDRGTVFLTAGLELDVLTGDLVVTGGTPTAQDTQGEDVAIADLFDITNLIDLGQLSLFDGVLLAVDGVDLFLGGLQDVLDGEVFGVPLPLIGDSLSDGARFIGDLREGFLADFRDGVEGAEDFAEDLQDRNKNILSRLLFDALAPTGLLLYDTDDGDPETLAVATRQGLQNGLFELNDAVRLDTNLVLTKPIAELREDLKQQDTFMQWDMTLGQSLLDVETEIDIDLGIPGLGFEAEGPLGLKLGWQLDFGFGLDLGDGFYFSVDPNAPELEVEIDVTLPDRFGGQLAFLQLDALNTGSLLSATFGVDVRAKGNDATPARLEFGELGRLELDAGIQAKAVADFDLELALNSDLLPGVAGVFPTVRADFLLDWGLGASADDLASMTGTVDFDASARSIERKDGGNWFADGFQANQPIVVSGAAGGAMSNNGSWRIASISDDGLTLTLESGPASDEPGATNVTVSGHAFFADLTGDAVKQGLDEVSFKNIQLDLGSFISDFIGPVLGGIQQVTQPIQPIVDFLTAPLPVISDIGPPVTLLDIAGVFGKVDPALLKSIADIVSLVNALPTRGDIALDFGDFVIFDRSAGMMDVDLTDPDTDLSTVQQPSPSLDQDVPDSQPRQKGFLNKLRNTEGLSFPILTDPSQVFGLLTGQPVTLMAYDMPALDLEFSYTQLFPIFPPLFATITGQVGAHIDFAFGFDSFGIQQFADTGFRNPELVFNGFFISDNPEDGTGSGPDLPELVLTGGLSAGAELNLGIARAGVRGGVFAEVDFDLFDPDRDGKIRIGELVESVETEFKFGKPIQAPLALFDVSGRIFAELRAFLKFNFLFTSVTVFDQAITPPITIVNFDLDFTRRPKLASIVDGEDGEILQLHMGEFAGLRLNGDLSDGNEEFKVTGGPSSLTVTWENSPERWSETFTGDFAGILALAGEGNDSVDLSGVTGPISFELEGGVGNDLLRGGLAATGGGSFRGGSGDDTLDGSGGEDFLYGGEGNDVLDGKGGRDILFGDGGRLTEGDVTLRRLDLEIIDDGVNPARIVRRDLGAWEDDGFAAGQRIELSGSSLADPDAQLPGSNGVYKVDQVLDNVLVLVELAPGDVDLDEIAGRAQNERTKAITIAIQNSEHLRAVKGQTAGTDGNDSLFGGLGDDFLFGSGGDDLLVGDGSRADLPGPILGDGAPGDGADVLVGDGGEIRFRIPVGRPVEVREVVDTNRGLEFGDDTLHGSGGPDSLYAGRGDDEAHGGLGEDWILVESGFDLAYGGPDADTLFGGDEADTLSGDAGPDTIFGGRGGDSIHGGAGNDSLFGETGSDLLFGDEDEDRIRGGSDPDVLFGGFGGTDVARTATTPGGGDDLDGGGGDDAVYGDFNPVAPLLDQIREFLPGEVDASLRITAAGSLLILEGPTGFSVAPGSGDAGGYAELGLGAGIRTSDADGRIEAFQPLARDGRLRADAELELTLPGNPAPTTLRVSLAAADTENFAPAGAGGDDLLTSSIGSDFLDGMDGNDAYVVNLRGAENARRFPAFDSGDGGLDPVPGNDQETGGDAKDVDILTINGTDFGDQFLLRASADPSGLAFVGLLNRADNVERVDYRGLEQLVVNGLGGDDAYAVDDARAIATLDGGPGDDFFQFGQLYKSLRNEEAANVSVGDVFATIATTRGFLSDGTTRPMVANGGAGEDEFRVFHNRAVLQINGQGGDDTISVRAFALAGSQDSVQDRTDISGGAGADFIQYAVNAPVNVDGGDGLDTVIVIGTEFADDFVVTDSGVFGAGRNVGFVNVEVLKVDGAEGDDRFFIQSTNEKIVTQIVGGLGSDSFNVAGDTPPVISNDLLGHSGIVSHGILTEGIEDLDPLYAGPDGEGIAVQGISANVADIDEPAIVLRESDGATRISEGGLVDSYTLALTQAPRRNVSVTVTAPVQSPEEKARGERMFGLSPIPFGPGVTAQDAIVLTFTPNNWETPQEVHVHALGSFDDDALEGERFGVINHLVESGDSLAGSLASAPVATVDVVDGRQVTTTTLSLRLASDLMLDPAAEDALRGRSLRVTSGEGAGQSLLVRDSELVQTDSQGVRTLQVTLLGSFQEGDLPAVGSGFAVDFYQNLQLPSVAVQVDDNDSADVIFTEIGGVTRVAEPFRTEPTDNPVFVEGAENDRYEVRLAREPRAGDTVVVEVSVKDEGIGADQVLLSRTTDGPQTSSLTLTFTTAAGASPWNVPQSVFVHAEDDALREGFHKGFIEHSVTTLLGTDVDELLDVEDPFEISDAEPRTSVLLTSAPLEFTGLASGGSTTTLVDSEADFDRDLSGYVIRIVRGTGVDLVSEIASNTGDTISIVGDWGLDAEGQPLQPDATSRYQISDVRVTVDPAELAAGTDLVFTADGRIIRTLGSSGVLGKWGSDGDGFQVGQTIVISGAGANDGTYEVADVNDTVLSVDTTFPAPSTDAGGNPTPIPDVSIVVPERDLTRFSVSAGTVIFLDAEGLPQLLGNVDVRVTYTSLDPGYDGRREERLSVDVLDDDTAGVLVTQVDVATGVADFSTDVVEGGGADAYDVVLTRQPTSDVQVVVAPQDTKTSRGGLITDAVQVGVALAPNSVPAGVVTLTFSPSDWNQPQRVFVKGLTDGEVDGGDTQVFAPMPHTLGGIQGPLVIDGSGGQGSLAGLTPPVLLPTETNQKESTGVVFDAEAGSADGTTPPSLTVFTAELLTALRPGETERSSFIGRTVEITRGDGTGKFARIVDFADAPSGSAAFTGAVTFDPSGDAADRIVRSSGSWSRDGFTAGQTITLTDNDGTPSAFAGTYTVAEVTALELILTSELSDDAEALENATITGEQTARTQLILDPGFGLESGESVDGFQAYAITDESVNFFVAEVDRVDILTVNDDDSPADSNGVLTTLDLASFPAMGELLPDVPQPGHLSGLGMGPDTRIARGDRPGGISFGRLEGLVVNLGLGDNTLDVDAVPLGADEVTGTGDLSRPGGFRTVTIVRGGGGDDTINVDLEPPTGLVAPLVAVDGQTGNDRIDAAGSSLPLVLFGGLDADTVVSGSGEDVIFGDRGRVDYFDATTGAVVTRLGVAPEDLRGKVDGNATTDFTLAVAELSQGGTELPVADDVLVGLQVRITEGRGFGQTRVIASNTASVITLQTAWAVQPDATSEFLITGVPTSQTDGVLRGPERILSVDRDRGGDDQLYGGDADDILIGGSANDSADGDAGADLVFGDQVLLELEPGTARAENPRFRTLADTTLYDANGEVQVDGTPRPDPSGAPAWVDWVITLGEAQEFAQGNTGDDYLAGGAGDDTLFGQAGNDTIQGDGGIESRFAAEPSVRGAERDADGLLEITPSVADENADGQGGGLDGDDYIEGNAGNDTIFGNLGQDDLVGGSSELFSLTRQPDGSDLIFGGSGEAIARDASGAPDPSPDRHARDSDAIVGDNGNIFRVLRADGSFEAFAYDQSSPFEDRGPLRIVPRAIQLLDYTPGGSDFDPAGQAGDIGAGDELHGEGGDDFVYGMQGPDVLFGEAGDDDLIGGYGLDWISGGSGRDGILGDDGRIRTSRNDTNAEPLHGVDGFAQAELGAPISTPHHDATINVEGELKKTPDLEPFNVSPAGAEDTLFDPVDADDILYGGLGSDSIHGGSGDDAISGAEALPEYYAAPANGGDVLGFGTDRLGEFDAYDEFDPLRKILVNADGVFTVPTDPTAREFLLNFDASEGPVDPRSIDGRTSDGDDKLFGDLGNDWIVGGSGRDHLYGGWGDDLLNADDDHDTTIAGADPRANNDPDTDFTYQDTAFGGAGRDVLIANTGGDRLIDWAGEFNSYLVPFSPFGVPTIFRAAQPQVVQFLYDLSKSDGADQTLAAAPGDARNGEPFGEIGVVTSQDAAWQDQHGGPADPQPGNDPGSRDVRVSADFNTVPAGFQLASGTAAVADGSLQLALAPLAADLDGDGVVGLTDFGLLRADFGSQVGGSPADLDGDGTVGLTDFGLFASAFGSTADPLALGLFAMDVAVAADTRFVIDTQLVAANGGGVVFDYHGPDHFKFALLREDTEQVVIGHYTATSGFVIDADKKWKVDPGSSHALELWMAGDAVSLLVDGENILSHRFDSYVTDGAMGLLALDGMGRFESFEVASVEEAGQGGVGPVLPLAAGAVWEGARRRRETGAEPARGYRIRELVGDEDATREFSIRELGVKLA